MTFIGGEKSGVGGGCCCGRWFELVLATGMGWAICGIAGCCGEFVITDTRSGGARLRGGWMGTGATVRTVGTLLRIFFAGGERCDGPAALRGEVGVRV